ncbi:MAG: 5-oxoprolinase subunit PxpB [Selenomonadaceae bacterium]
MLQAEKNNTAVKMSPLGEAGILVSFGENIDPATHDKVHAFARYLEQNPFAGMLEYTEAFTSVTIYYDILSLQNYKIEVVNQQQSYAFQAAEAILRNILPQVNFSGGSHLRTVRIPVCYGGELGPDLGEVAAFHRLSPQQVIDIHTGGEYLVYMIGFAPGFPYVGGLSNKIATPRRKMPRLAIPAGSVGIAGEQTGVYPLETPGGWQLIGRTPLSLFNPQAKLAPSLLQAGDRIEFYAISRQEYEAYGK